MFWQLKLRNLAGANTEKQALRHLKDEGLLLLMSNFACRLGEIDLIMLDKDTLVFIEVRYRSRSDFGSAASSINYKKQQKIRKTAAYFLQKNRQHSHRICRFDTVTTCNNDGSHKKSLEWIKSAF